MRVLICSFVIVTAVSSKVICQNFRTLNLDQNLPDSIPEIFAKGIISKEYAEFGITIMPDYSEIFFTRRGANPNPRNGKIMVLKNINGKWSEPAIASFSGKYNDMEPLISPDGKYLLFGSNRPIVPESSNGQFNQWYVEKVDSGWSKAKIFKPLQNIGFVMYPTITNSGNIYYTSQDGIYVIRFSNDIYCNPEKLPESINKLPRAAHSFISPDESFLIFDAQPRGNMKSDLFISISTEGIWQDPEKLSKYINSSESQAVAFVTLDKKWMFFVRNGDIYWVSIKQIEERFK